MHYFTEVLSPELLVPNILGDYTYVLGLLSLFGIQHLANNT